MANTKWLRRALLGGVAVSVMATGAQADELTALKAQLEALQSRVNSLEAQPAPAAPAGASYLTFERGQGGNANWGNASKVDSVNQSQNRGFTIGITPTADLPAPVAEVTVYGYVKGDVIYDVDDDLFTRSFSGVGSALPLAGSNDQFRMHANQSRFGIKSKVDTAIGQIRTRLEGDFEGAPYGTNSAFRLRHAYGEWDMTPNWTLLIGRYWFIGSLLPIGISTVDFAGTLWTYTRNEQIRLTYHDGPITFAFGIDEGQFRTNTATPNFAAYFQYDAAGGHQFVAAAEVGDWDNPAVASAVNNATAWMVSAGLNLNLGDIASLTAAAVYGEGLYRRYCLAGQLATPTHTAGGNAFEAWCTLIGVSFSLSETLTFNAAWDHGDIEDSVSGLTGVFSDDYNSVRANIIWQPVKQMRWGWEVIYADFDTNRGGNIDTVRAQFGAWFFF